MTKEEMIADAIEIMKEKVVGFTDGRGSVFNAYSKDHWYYDTAVRYLDYLEIGIDKVIDFLHTLQTPIRFADFFRLLGKSGFLSITPKVRTVGYSSLWQEWEELEVPKYQIRWNRFLGWFRGYRFQVSGGMYAEGNCGSSSTTLVPDLRICKVLPDKLKPVMVFSHICQATNGYNEFIDNIKQNPNEFSKFINLTNEQENIHCKDFDLVSFLNDLLVEESNLPSKPIRQVCLYEESSESRPGNNAFAIMAFSKTYVAFSLLNEKGPKTPRWKIINMPERPFVDEYDLYAPYTPWEDISEQSYYRIMWIRLSWVMLSLQNIVANYQYVYPQRRGIVGYVPLDVVDNSFVSVSDMGEFEQHIEALAKAMEPSDNNSTTSLSDSKAFGE